MIDIKFSQGVIYYARPVDYKKEKEKDPVPALRVLTMQEGRQAIAILFDEHCNKIQPRMLIEYTGGGPNMPHMCGSTNNHVI